MQRVLITGAAGLVGAELTMQLAAQNNYIDIHCALRDELAQERLAAKLRRCGIPSAKITPHFVDLECFEEVLHLVQSVKADVVFHTAARVSLLEKDNEPLVESNVDMTHFVVESLLDLKKSGLDPLLVHVSSVAAFGKSDARGVIDETTPVVDVAHMPAYARSKFLCQNDVLRASKMGLKVVMVAPSVILGPNNGHGQMDGLFAIIAKGLNCYTDSQMGYVDVRDVARAMIQLSENPETWGTIYCLNGKNMSFRDLIYELGKPFARKRPSIRLGRRRLRFAARLLLMISKKGGKKPILTLSLVDYLTEKVQYDGSKIEKALPQFTYTPIEETAQYIARNLN